MPEITSEALMALIQQQGQMLQLMAAKELGHTHNNEEWQEKATSMLTDLITKAPATTMTAQKLHGLAGTFSTAGLDRDVISAVVRPYGLGQNLPLFPSVEEDPRFGALTGVSDDIGSEAATPCADAPTGYITTCNLTAQFGRLSKQTNTIEMDKVMLRVNRGDFTDLVLRGYQLGNEFQGGMFPSQVNPADALNIVTAAEMLGVGERTYRDLNKQTWQGTPANNNAGGGYKEFPGLDVQIATGQVDADTGNACVALDSDVKDFNYVAVGTGSGNNIVTYLSMLEYYLVSKAEDKGLMPVTWKLCMRPQLFYELTAVWPILYNSDKVAALTGNGRLNLMGNDVIRERDTMRQGKYLMINGRRYEVETDTGIFEHNNINNGNLIAGEYASSIYFVPMTITGNFPVTYRQYVDYRRAAMDNAFLRGKENFWTDSGTFSWAFDDVKWCYTLTAKTEQRVVLRTPQLAGRLDHVKYSPLQHLSEADPASPYNQNGGFSVGPTSTKNAVWL